VVKVGKGVVEPVEGMGHRLMVANNNGRQDACPT
jgi:hypothetical protein